MFLKGSLPLRLAHHGLARKYRGLVQSALAERNKERAESGYRAAEKWELLQVDAPDRFI
jgi:hypothetical protein